MKQLGGILFLLLIGCAPTYHRDRSVFSGDCEGYKETKIDSTSYLVTICGGYPYDNADLYVLYRAAEWPVAAGKTYFAVIENPPTHAKARAAKRIRMLDQSTTDT